MNIGDKINSVLGLRTQIQRIASMSVDERTDIDVANYWQLREIDRQLCVIWNLPHGN